jgi:hypothetical protein
LNGEASEGAYTFRPEWKDPLPKQFSKLREDITYQQGALLDQWTITYNDKQTKERAVINVRYTPLNPEFIEIDVELSPVPIKDGQGKDVVVTWAFFDSFDPNGTFYTDSNGLEMQKRVIRNITSSTPDSFLSKLADSKGMPNYATIGANFFPVDSAIAMRDVKGGSNL